LIRAGVIPEQSHRLWFLPAQRALSLRCKTIANRAPSTVPLQTGTLNMKGPDQAVKNYATTREVSPVQPQPMNQYPPAN